MKQELCHAILECDICMLCWVEWYWLCVTTLHYQLWHLPMRNLHRQHYACCRREAYFAKSFTGMDVCVWGGGGEWVEEEEGTCTESDESSAMQCNAWVLYPLSHPIRSSSNSSAWHVHCYYEIWDFQRGRSSAPGSTNLFALGRVFFLFFSLSFFLCVYVCGVITKLFSQFCMHVQPSQGGCRRQRQGCLYTPKWLFRIPSAAAVGS